MFTVNLPTMLHVLWFVHANGKLDLEVVVWTTFRHGHLVELRLLGTVGSRMEHNLEQAHHNNNVCELCCTKVCINCVGAMNEFWEESIFCSDMRV